MNVHYFWAGVALLGLGCLTFSHVWRVIGIGQSLINYLFLITFCIDHFRKGRRA